MIKFHAECIQCIVDGAIEKSAWVNDPILRMQYIQEVCRIFTQLDPAYDSAPIADAQVQRLRRDLLHITGEYTQAKHTFNRLLLSMQDQLRKQIEASDDPLYASIRIAIAGNYIDFGVIKDVQEEQLMQLLSKAHTYQLDQAEYAALQNELQSAKRCTVFHDNCGEIVLDKLMIEQIHRRYPNVQVTSVVRESDILNDATMEDAEQIRLGEVADVIPNGIPGLPGTQIDRLPKNVLSILNKSDVIIAKGQGNFETMCDTKLNVYFMLLAKCKYYTQWFGFPHFGCVLANANRMQEKLRLCETDREASRA